MNHVYGTPWTLRQCLHLAYTAVRLELIALLLKADRKEVSND